MLSQLLHSTPPSLAGQLKQGGGAQQFLMQIGRSHHWLETAFATAFIFFAQISDLAFKTFDLTNDRLDSTIGAFSKLDPGSA
jgi:hypothetical protein